MDQTRETIKYFWRHVWRYKKYVVGIFTVTPLAIFFHTFLSSLIISGILQRLASGKFIPHDFFGSFGPTLLLYVVVYLMGNVVLYRILTFLMWRLETNVSRDIAEEVFSHLMAREATFHNNRQGGALVSQTTRLISAYERLADTTIYSAAPLILIFTFATIVLLPRVPLYVLLLLALASMYLAIALISAKKIRHFNTTEAEAASAQTGSLADSITNIMTVKSFGHEIYETSQFKKATKKTAAANDKLMKATLRRDTYFSMVGSSFSITTITMVIIAVMFLGADISTAFLMLTYSLAIASSLWGFSSQALRTYNRALGDAHDMIGILKQPPTIKDSEKPMRRIKGSGVVFKNISFTHEDARTVLFKNFNLSIAEGEKVGLIGRSGSGKTTLTKLLLRFADVDNGEIQIGDQPITDISQQSLRQAIAYVPQEPLLFHRTIKENIAYGKPGASITAIREAAKQANALEFINELPRGFDTLVGERGVKLSGGQRQRIAIARAILKDAPILVLDEATSALDSESEKAIQKALQKLMKGRTTVVVAHRLSTIASLDRIVVLDKGKIIEEGTHVKLLEQDGTYAKLWQHQSSGFIDE